MASEISSRRHELMKQLWDEGKSVRSIAKDQGISDQGVRKILETKFNIDTSTRKHERNFDQKPLSNLHAQIGNRINLYRSFDLNMTLDDAAFEIRLSNRRLSNIEKGIHNLTLDELARIAKWMELPITHLISTEDSHLNVSSGNS